MQRAQSPRRSADADLTRLDELVETTTALSLALRSCDGWTGPQRGRALHRLDRLAGALAAPRSGLLLAERRARTSIAPGDRDVVAARARATRAGLGGARREVRQAETIEAMPAMADAVREGRVPLPHVDVLARVTSGAQWQRRESFLVMSHQPEGTFLKGRLDHLSAEAVRVAITSVRQAPDDERDEAQADADALVALAECATSGMARVRRRRTEERGLLAPDGEQDAADGRGSGVASQPTVPILVPAQSFAELHKARQRDRHCARNGCEVPAAEIPRLAAPRRARGAPPGEPTRYEFRRADVSVIGAPLGPGAPADPTVGRTELVEVA